MGRGETGRGEVGRGEMGKGRSGKGAKWQWGEVAMGRIGKGRIGKGRNGKTPIYGSKCVKCTSKMAARPPSLNDIKNLFDVHNPQTIPDLGVKVQTI